MRVYRLQLPNKDAGVPCQPLTAVYTSRRDTRTPIAASIVLVFFPSIVRVIAAHRLCVRVGSH